MAERKVDYAGLLADVAREVKKGVRAPEVVAEYRKLGRDHVGY